MSRKYFGTDGVRGKVGHEPMTVEFALRLASAAARVLAPNGGTALVGKDTRLSGYMFEAALEAGFVAAGVNVNLIGPLPTPGIAYMAQKFGCKFGVVISASHNLSKTTDQVLRRAWQQAHRRAGSADRGLPRRAGADARIASTWARLRASTSRASRTRSSACRCCRRARTLPG